jgi:hypothetical protein
VIGLVTNLPATDLTGDGTNFTFTFVQPALGLVNIRWTSGYRITDFGFPTVPPFDASGPGATWSYALIDGQTWR